MFRLTLLMICLGAINAVSINYEPDYNRNATELIRSRGFTPKTYTTVTSDGYILTVFRIVNPHWEGKTKRSVLLQHGFTGNADNFMINTPGRMASNGTYIEDTGVVTDCSALDRTKMGATIAFVLAACGYDVWLGNQRGTSYSSGHTEYQSQTDINYWKFNVDDLVQDTMAMINLVKNETNSDTVGYIAHSLGTTQMFEMLSEHPQMNKVVKPFIALAPIAHIGHINLFDRFAALLEPLIENTNGPMLIVPSNNLVKVDQAIANVCSLPIIKDLCKRLMFLSMGENYQDTNPDKYQLLMRHWPDGTSFKVLAQMMRWANTDTFAHWDYRLANLAHYGHLTPPKYDLTKITNEHIALISGTNDAFADPKDLDRLRNELKVELFEDYIVPDSKYEHLDFILADNAGEMVTAKILSILSRL